MPYPNPLRFEELERQRQLLRRQPVNQVKAREADGYEQPESFSLMEYWCKAGHAEIIWNSRPHVTPFIIRCRFCDGESTHDAWVRDTYAPYHCPITGDRVFVDLTMDVALLRAKQFVDKRWDGVDYPLKGLTEIHSGSKQQAAEYFAKQWTEDYGGHAPDLLLLDEPQAAQLREESIARESAKREAIRVRNHQIRRKQWETVVGVDRDIVQTLLSGDPTLATRDTYDAVLEAFERVFDRMCDPPPPATIEVSEWAVLSGMRHG